MMRTILFPILLFILFAGCQSRQAMKSRAPVGQAVPLSFCAPKTVVLDTEPGPDGSLTPLFWGLTDHFSYPVSTGSKKAQKFFDQGLMLAYGFNHAEAARSFREAARLDPECAMAYWGLAYVLGPNYNAGMDPNTLPHALEAIEAARARMHNCTAKEQLLINTIAKRYPKSKDEDPQPYYQAYADALKAAHRQYPDDLDLAAMTAEALMDMHPWDLWEKDGTAKAWTPEIIDLIEGTLAKDPRHPQAIHLYVHATEASGNPERAIPYAKTLERLVPGSGHLVHMPSHTYINTGQYHEGTLANERAVKIDSLYVETCHEGGIYPLAYYPHNWHFLAACAALEGRGNRALEASRYMADYVVDQKLMYEPEMATLQHYYTIPWNIMVKFAMWDEILAEKKPDDGLPYLKAIWEYARGMAYCGKGNLDAASQSLKVLKTLETDTTIAKMTIWEINKATDIVRIARYVLEGEMAYRQGKLPESIRLLKQAVDYEDQLNYNEPPDWFFSVRHPLGHVLLEAGRYREAENVFRKDLEEYKENGWALMGLYQSLAKQHGRSADANAVLKRYKNAWQWADIKLGSSVVMN
ncbi:MAG: hypothetical protein H6575_11570 [Lewinellaceae bacterium]|nr:hypothetical protein [Lewinellaceae bacterium]